MLPKIANSITKCVDILKILSDGTDRIGDIANKLSLTKGTTHRLLKSLEISGLVMQYPTTRRYYLGSLILKLASKPVIAHQNLVVFAFEEMKYLRNLCKETVVLHIRIGLERICLEEVQSLETIKYTSGKGFIAPIYTGSAGKILLSELDENELDLLLRHLRLDRIGPNTITDRKALLKELNNIRKQGYATSFGERIQGSASFSVPVKNYICPVALSILEPDNRFSLKIMMGFLKEMKNSASRISKKLMEANQRRGSE